MAGGDSSEWSQREGGPGLWPKCRLSCHRPGLLATSPAPSPGQAGQPGQPGPCPHWSSRQSRTPSQGLLLQGKPGSGLSPPARGPAWGSLLGPGSSLLKLGPLWFSRHTCEGAPSPGVTWERVDGAWRGQGPTGVVGGAGGLRAGVAASGSWSKPAQHEGAFLARAGSGPAAPGEEARWGQAGAGCSWERPERSLRADSAACPPRPAYLPPLGEGVGRRAGGRSPPAWGPGREHTWPGWLLPPTAGTQHSSWGPRCRSGVRRDPRPRGRSVPQPLLASPPRSTGSQEAQFLRPGVPLFADKSLPPPCLRGSAQATPSKKNQHSG